MERSATKLTPRATIEIRYSQRHYSPTIESGVEGAQIVSVAARRDSFETDSEVESRSGAIFGRSGMAAAWLRAATALTIVISSSKNI